MSNIHVSAKFANISSSNLAEFKEVAADALEIAKRERGALRYDWYFDDQATVCVVQETYEDRAALSEHVVNVGDAFGRLIALGGGCELEVFGHRPPELAEAPAGLRRTAQRRHLPRRLRTVLRSCIGL